ncbi:MAG: hypothetical protein FIB08_04180 [Candidatus Methanoperedens sp.]|nr:hypothetical protein [Candidatus Methanoperedens sp.]
MAKIGYRGVNAQGSSNDILMFGVVIVGIGLIGYYLLRKTADDTVKGLKDAAGDAVGAIAAIPSQIIAIPNVRIAENTKAIEQAANRTGYQDWLSGQGYIPQVIVNTGNAIAPTQLLETATSQGTDFRQDLIANNDLQRLENDPLKPLIVVGEGLTRTFTGLSPYEAGVATRDWFNNIWK